MVCMTPTPKPLTAAAARRMLKAFDAEWQQVSDDWFTGGIATAAEMDRRYDAIKARYPRRGEAATVKMLADSATAARRQAKRQAAFGC